MNNNINTLITNLSRTEMTLTERENNARLNLRDMPEAEARQAGATIQRAKLAVNKLLLDTIKARDDQQLSDSYRAEVIDKATESFITEIVQAEQHADTLAVDAEKMLDAVKVPEVDAMLQQARFAEIRQRLAGEDPTRLARKYQTDINDGVYSELVQALEDDPMPRDFVTAGTRQASRVNRAGAIDPEAVKRYNAMLTGARVGRQFANSIAGFVSGVPGAGFTSFR